MEADVDEASGDNVDDDEESEEDDDDDDGDEENSIDSKRITFLVNVWLNHKPILSENLPEEVRETLEFGEADFEDLFEKNEKAPEGKKERRKQIQRRSYCMN